MILTLAPIALALSMAGQPSLDAAAQAALAQSPAALVSQDGDAVRDQKKKQAKQKRGDAKKRGEGERAAKLKALRKRFDLDGDGKLNEAESKALREHVQAERKKAAGDKTGAQQGGRRQGANGGAAERRDALKKRFDADGDGKLSETERAALKKHMETQRKEAADEARKKEGEGIKRKRKRVIKKKKAAKAKEAAEKKTDGDGI